MTEWRELVLVITGFAAFGLLYNISTKLDEIVKLLRERR